MNTKKTVLWIGIGATLILILLGVGESKLGLDCSLRVNERMDPYAGGFVAGGNGEYQPGLRWDTIEWCEPFAFSLMPLLTLLILSLITYKMRDEVFRAWWGFARWWIVVIIAVTLFLQNAGGGGGMGIGGAVSDAFDVLVLGIFYAVLILVSLVKILRAYLKTRHY